MFYLHLNLFLFIFIIISPNPFNVQNPKIQINPKYPKAQTIHPSSPCMQVGLLTCIILANPCMPTAYTSFPPSFLLACRTTSRPLNLPPTCMSDQITTLSPKFSTPTTLPCPLPSPPSPTCMHAYPLIAQTHAMSLFHLPVSSNHPYY